jgi:phosphotransferase system enzyme I (PtsI)
VSELNSATGCVITGLGVSPGIASGPAVVLDRRRVTFGKRNITDAEVNDERGRLDAAIATSLEQLQGLKKRVTDGRFDEHAKIFEAHELMMQDDLLVQGTRELIGTDQINAEWALQRTLDSITEFFTNLEDDYIRERVTDIETVGDRIMRNLTGQNSETLVELLANVKEPSILVARELTPADTIQLYRTKIIGFCTDDGTRTTHTAITARSLEIPAVVGAQSVFDETGYGDIITLDGDSGEICVRPSPEQAIRFEKRHRKVSAVRRKLQNKNDQPATTTDGFEVTLSGNIELLDELDFVDQRGGRGVGLYRTEFLFMNRSDMPGETEQFEAYCEVLKRAAPHPATIRTLDIGGDKLELPVALGETLNPFFGLRAIRYCLQEQTLFRVQLRAMLRASMFGKLRILIPFVTDVTEIRQVKVLIADVTEELQAEGKPVAEDIMLGAMIEIPSAALIADVLACECDFFSVGTNDLIQYTLAIARNTTGIDHLYHPLHPAVLRILSLVSDAAHKEGIHLSMCGEMAGEPLYSVVLLGLRFNELSMNARSIPVVREIIQRTPLRDARALLKRALTMSTYQEIEALVAEHMGRTYPDLRPLLNGT